MKIISLSSTAGKLTGKNTDYFHTYQIFKKLHPDKEKKMINNFPALQNNSPSIKYLPYDYGLHISFGSNMPGFSHIEYAREDGDYRISKNNTLFTPIDRGSNKLLGIAYTNPVIMRLKEIS